MFSRGLRRFGLFPVLALLLGQLPHVILRRLAQLLHQLGDLLIRGAVLHRLRQPLLRPAQPFERIRQVAILEQHRQIPHRGGQFVTLRTGHAGGGKALEPALDGTHPQVGHGRPEKTFGTVGDGTQDHCRVAGIAARPQERPALVDDGGGERIEKPAAGQRRGQGLWRAGLVAVVDDPQLDGDRQVGPGMLREILDQSLVERRPRAGNRQRQWHPDRRARLGLDGQAMAAVDLGQIEPDGGLAGADAVIVLGLEGQGHLAARGGGDLVDHAHLRGGVCGERDLPVTAARAVDHQRPGLAHLKALRGLGHAFHLGSAARDRLARRQRTDLAVKPQGDATALGHLQRAAGLIGKVERRQAGIGRRLDPAFPGRARGQRLAAGGDAGDRRDLPERAEEQRHRQRQNRHVAQGKGIAPRHPQIRRHGARLGGARGHAILMRLPDRDRGGITAADRLIVTQGLQRPSPQRRIEPVERLVAARPAEPAQAKAQRQQPAQRKKHDQRPDRLERQEILHTEHQEGKRHKRHRPQRPEGTRHTLGPEAEICQGHRAANAAHTLKIPCRPGDDTAPY